MSHPQDIIRLYSTILFHDVNRYFVSDADMKAAIGDMHRVYKPDPGSLSGSARRLADYNLAAYRCAYLHKYAPFHTAMVCDVMRWILQRNANMFLVLQKRISRITRKKKFKICSLGGGPGSDTVGVLVAMFEHFGLFPCSAKVIDIKSDWKDTMSSVIRGLSTGLYGPVGEGFTWPYFNWDYLTADLLEEVFDGDVKSAIGSADLMTMVKFVSAAACESTEWMLKKIFTMMELGAVVLFIDNSAGGFRQLVSKAATDCNLTSVCGPINYELYTDEAFNITHWDHTSCYSTTITVHMMQKLQHSPPTIPNRVSIPIQDKLSSNKHGNPTKMRMGKINAIQNENSKHPINESAESECVPSTQRNGRCATEISIIRETKSCDCSISLSSKTENSHQILNNASSAIIDFNSKNNQSAHPINQSDVNEFTIIEDCLLIPPKETDGIDAELSTSRRCDKFRREESSTPNPASISNESSEPFRTEGNEHNSFSSHVPCDVIVEISELEENAQEIDSVGKLVSPVFDASTKNLQEAQTYTSSDNSTFKLNCPWCTIL